MKNLVYPNERTLGAITLVLGIIVWLLLIVGSFGTALIVLLIGYVFYLFAQSAFISYIKGDAVELSAQQFPDIHAQFVSCCEKLEISQPPKVYVLNGHGGLNAFATRFLRTEYVVLMSDVVDAMAQHSDGVSFYIGHELGHLKRKHLSGGLLRWPALWLPLLGAAYSRARETTCDRHGLACSTSPENAARALAALSAGSDRWRTLDLPTYLEQVKHSSGFWMSFHELLSGYPWLTKRVARVINPDKALPSRNFFAYCLAIFFPFAGRLGAGFGLLMLVYIVGILAAVALPAYQDYIVKAELETALVMSVEVQSTLADFYETNEYPPETLEEAGLSSSLADGTEMLIDADNMELTLLVEHGEFILVPLLDEDDLIYWECRDGTGIKWAQLPTSCSSE